MKRRAARGVSVNDAHHQLGKLLGVNVRVLGQGRNKKKSGQVDPNFYSDRARMQGLRNLARAVFRTRNARGMPKKYRLTVKSAARPELRQTIKHTRQARDALRVGNIGRFDHMHDKAVTHLLIAYKHFSAPAWMRPRNSRPGCPLSAQPVAWHGRKSMPDLSLSG